LWNSSRWQQTQHQLTAELAVKLVTEFMSVLATTGIRNTRIGEPSKKFNWPPRLPIPKYIRNAVLFNVALTGVFIALDNDFLHWFVVPTSICGAVCLSSLIRAARQEQLFTDPLLLISLLGYHNTYLAPMLQVYWDYRIIALPTQPDDFRPWLGRLACIDLVGVAIFFYVFSRVVNRPANTKFQTTWRIDRRRLVLFGFVIILASIAMQMYVYADFGGISGYVDKYLYDREAWNNKGALLVIAESAPLIAVLILGCLQQERLRRGRVKQTSWLLLIACGFVFLMLQIVFGGLRGSRSNIVVNCFFAAGIVHQVFRPLSKRVIIFLGIAAVVFSYYYIFFKDFGYEGVSAAVSLEGRESLLSQSGRSTENVLIADFSRSDIQSYILQELEGGQDVELAKGRTYLGTLSLLVPRIIWPDRPPTKLKWTTELESGPGSYGSGVFPSTRMYGQLGEAMLNFGYLGVPISFALMGFVFGKLSTLSPQLWATDARRLLLPGMVIASVCMVIQDSDNVLYFIVQYLAIPWTIVWISTSRYRLGYAVSPINRTKGAETLAGGKGLMRWNRAPLGTTIGRLWPISGGHS
jgi:hypothetical protein